MFSAVLVANRGEIAVRVMRTLRGLGIRSIAVYSDADARARHVVEADLALRIGPPPAVHSYLSIDSVITAALSSGADAVHPGYGFLSENAAFAQACHDAGLVFIGPPVSAIESMGDKIRAKRAVAAVDVPVVPGSSGAGLDDAALARAALEVGLPVLLKPSAGGGGKGMREIHDASELADAISAARRVAASAFGDDTLLIERLIAEPRHIEVQIVADAYGNTVHLGERECTLQRRHQKIIEEAPSPILSPAQRSEIGAAAIRVAEAVGYTGAGTVEFIADARDLYRGESAFYFMEMNTRLQVEHPVTEMITGLDIVELQLRVAAGEPLPLAQRDVVLSGHAMEARVYAEDPAAGFLPTGGEIHRLVEPRLPGVRVDSGVLEGTVVGSEYDPMLLKVIAHGTDRREALRRLDAALAQTTILGLGTNTAFLRRLLADEDVQAAKLDTGLVGRRLDELVGVVDEIPDQILVAAALTLQLHLDAAGRASRDPYATAGGWRIGSRAWTTHRLRVGASADHEVRLLGTAQDAVVALPGSEPVRASAYFAGDQVVVRADAATRSYTTARSGDALWIARDGRCWEIRDVGPSDPRSRTEAGSAGPVFSPMPGTVILVEVTEGQWVETGARLAVVEAMKMEHVLRAPTAGVITNLRARPGGSVDRSDPLMTIAPTKHD